MANWPIQRNAVTLVSSLVAHYSSSGFCSKNETVGALLPIQDITLSPLPVTHPTPSVNVLLGFARGSLVPIITLDPVQNTESTAGYSPHPLRQRFIRFRQWFAGTHVLPLYVN